MSLLARIFAGLGAFLIVADIAYALASRESEGVTLIITVAAGALIVGGYLLRGVRRGRSAPAEPAEDEPHIGPTLWPLVVAVSTIGLVVGAVVNRWALLAGVVLLVAALGGWVVDVRRQWREGG